MLSALGVEQAHNPASHRDAEHGAHANGAAKLVCAQAQE